MTIVKFLHEVALHKISRVRSLVLLVGFFALAVASTAEARPYRLLWDANTDGITAGYFVYYGTAPGTYQPADGVDAGNTTEFQVNLLPGNTYYFQVRAYDSTGTLGSPSTELSFVVPNTAPVLTNPGSQSNATGNVVSRQLVATDADNDGLTFTVTGLPPGLSASASGLISGTIAGSASGSYSVTATVSDGAAQDVESFTWSTPVQPTLTIGDITVTEGNSGTSLATFTVTLSPVNASQTVTVNYATANGTATTSNNDYAAASGTLTFTPSAATRTFSVTINGDTTTEPNETFSVNLSGATNAAIGDAQATGTISNDDAGAQSTLTIGNVTVTEGNSGTSLATFTVTLSPVNASQTVTVNYATANGTATGSDYVAASGTLTFTPSAATRTINVTINGDTAVEPNETFSVNLSGAANAAIGDGQATGTITNDDAAAQSTLTIGDVAITEGQAGTSLATFTVTLSPVNASQTVTVNYATANGTATVNNNDYESASGTLTFTPSAATRTLNVIVNGDTTVEPNQTFLVNLSSATNATISDAQAVGTITNDDVGGAAATVNVVSTSVVPGRADSVHGRWRPWESPGLGHADAGLGRRQRIPGLEVPERVEDGPRHGPDQRLVAVHRAVHAGHLQRPLLCQ